MTRRARESPAEAKARRAGVDDPEVVLQAAARFLEARPRAIAEVRRRLSVAGYRPELIDGAVARLEDLGVLDDAGFAAAWVESRDRARPRSARALRDELRRKGVPSGDIEAALAARESRATGAVEDGDAIEPLAPDERATSARADLEAAARLLDRRGASILREADPRKRRAKAYGLLARNGFDPETCATSVAAWVLRVEAPDQGGPTAGPPRP